MPTPVGHGLAGLAVFFTTQQHLSRRHVTALLLIFMALLPDLDFLFGFAVSDPNRFHHGFSHSFVFVWAIGLLMAAIWAKYSHTSLKIYAAVFGVAGSSHVLLDLLAADTSVPYGAQIFWPFSKDYYIAPFAIFLDIKRASSMDKFWQSLFIAHNFRAVFLEVLLLGPLVWFGKKIGNR